MFRTAVAALLVAYPLLVWFGLARLGAPLMFAVLLGLLGLRTVARARQPRAVIAGIVLALTGLVAALTDTGTENMLRWYPVLASVFAGSVFAASLFSGRPLIERIARLKTPELPPAEITYTRRLTVTWTALIFANALVAAWTALYADLAFWALYNGLLSYLLLGGFFLGEWLYRRRRLRGA